MAETQKREMSDTKPQNPATDETLRRLVQEAIDSGPGIEADAVFARLKAKYGVPRPQ